MDNRALSFNKKTATKLPEDLYVLANTYSLSKLNYIDIAQQEHFVKMMKDWPLLAELAQLTSPNTN
ncbi:cellulose biosynthesis protein BcsR [Legionella fallonii]|uniref:Uncharacterized yhjR n=1 Tax=Legionella fallonii LLAP-10 TaxID=1212491 RepID=A0A098GB46_9GAMM|nr:cellulose biosynthesis protein BcsR [Legionella fallonii]CEG58691.1 putative uncharacterized yhjR [Legionella fallonii LLAP-10]